MVQAKRKPASTKLTLSSDDRANSRLNVETFGLWRVSRYFSLRRPYKTRTISNDRVSKPPRDVETFSLPWTLKLGISYQKISERISKSCTEAQVFLTWPLLALFEVLFMLVKMLRLCFKAMLTNYSLYK